jgi:hypothetical protein
MASLKAFLPVLARILGTTPDALYSRQRALVNLGLLAIREGRGPGSGVELSADSVGVMLIACLCSDTLAGTDQRVVDICNAGDVFSSEKFRQAVTSTLSEPDRHTNQTLTLSVSRCHTAARTYSLDGNINATIYHVAPKEISKSRSPIDAVSEIHVTTLQDIRNELKKFPKEDA